MYENDINETGVNETGVNETDVNETDVNAEQESESMDFKSFKAESIVREIFEWIGVIVSAVVISLFINFCVLVNAKVPSASMENTIMTGDRLFGSRWSYAFADPERGDIVIFRYPDNEKILYIKRVIGLPGETVEIHNGAVYIDGEILEEQYLNEIMEGDFGPYEVPEGEYFMMGDNRNNSADSRYWEHTYVEKSKIIGKALFKYYPGFKVIKHGDYD